MEIIRMKMEPGQKKDTGLFIRVIPDEALKLIQSLSAQLLYKNPNNEREEFYANDGTYFTIGVHQYLRGNQK